MRVAALGGGALSPLPEVQLVESLTPDSPSQVLTLDVHRTDAQHPTKSVHITSVSASSARTGVLVGQSSIPPTSPPAAALVAPRALHPSPYPQSPPTPPSTSLLSSALLEADLDYFHVDRETAIAVEQITTASSAPHSPHSNSTADDGTDLTWEEEEEEQEEYGERKEDELGVVQLRGGESLRYGGNTSGGADESDVCRVQESGGSTDDDYEML